MPIFGSKNSVTGEISIFGLVNLVLVKTGYRLVNFSTYKAYKMSQIGKTSLRKFESMRLEMNSVLAIIE